MNTVIAPIDFSRASRGVIDEAIRLARSVEGRVVVMHVVRPPVFASELAPMTGGTMQVAADFERALRENWSPDQ